MIGKIRPQIFMALFMLSLITGYAINAGMVEIATGTVGGLVALGMKVLENDSDVSLDWALVERASGLGCACVPPMPT